MSVEIKQMKSKLTRQNYVIDLIKNVCIKHKELLKGHKIILFGSRAQERSEFKSDFDIGIIGKEQLDLGNYFILKDAIENLPTLFQIDLVDLCRVHDKFRTEALKNYQVIYG